MSIWMVDVAGDLELFRQERSEPEVGFEPTTSALQEQRSGQLSYPGRSAMVSQRAGRVADEPGHAKTVRQSPAMSGQGSRSTMFRRST